MSIGIWINVVFFLGMGVCALVRPQFVVSFVKLVPETADARNEVRAVYGGFGIAIAVLLAGVAQDVGLRSGVLLAVAVALLGMAAGSGCSASALSATLDVGCSRFSSNLSRIDACPRLSLYARPSSSAHCRISRLRVRM